MRTNRIIPLEFSGSPYGRGFVGLDSEDNGASWVYRGDIGPSG